MMLVYNVNFAKAGLAKNVLACQKHFTMNWLVQNKVRMLSGTVIDAGKLSQESVKYSVRLP